MSVTRRILNWFRRGASKVRAVANRYEAAVWSTARRYLDQWVRDARYDIDQPTRQEILRKARYFEANSAIVNRCADLFEQYVVGTGIPLIPATSNPDWNEAASTWLSEWMQFCDLSTRAHFYSIQSLIARTWFVEGEIFVLLTSGNDPKRPFPRIQLIEPHRVKTPGVKVRDANIIDGIEYDANMRPVAYWVASTDPTTNTETYSRVEAFRILHIFEPSRAGQLRGLSFLYPVMVDLENLDLLHLLELKFAKSVAVVPKLFYGSGGAISPDDINRTEDVTTTSGTRRKQVQEILGADVEYLTDGEKYEQFGSERPSVASQWLYKDTEIKICAGIGIQYQLVFPESMQGTVARGVYEMQAAWFRARSSVLEAFWTQIYVWAIDWARKFDGRLRGAPEDWYKVRTRAPRSVVVDSGRTLSGMVQALNEGLITYESAFAELGQDWREQLRQKADEIAYLTQLAEERGIKTADIAKGVSGAIAAQGGPPAQPPSPPSNRNGKVYAYSA